MDHDSHPAHPPPADINSASPVGDIADAVSAIGPAIRPSWAFMRSNPWHILALGAGAGLSPKAPGTAGTLWAWAAFVLLQRFDLSDRAWAALLAASMVLGVSACAITARNLRMLDPGSIVWDEIAAFWLVLWLIGPVGFLGQLAAFALFRYFDAAKPGPVAWADGLFHSVDPRADRFAWQKAGFGIMLDDLVAAGCTLLVIAVSRFI